MDIKLSDHFSYGKLLRFTFPSVIMMIFTSIYGVVDGFFVSNFAGKTAFAAVNLIMPFLMILGTVGFMFGSGGSALIGKTLGEGDRDKADRLFTLFVYVSIVISILLAVVSYLLLPQIVKLLGGEGQLHADAVLYGRIILVATPAYVLQFEFQTLFITAEKPKLGLMVTVVSGVANIVLDFLFVGIFKWGLIGAAAATTISQYVGGVIPLVYFSRKNTSLLRFVKTSFDGKALIKACTNGSSELVNNISMSLVGILYNIQLLAFAGENGVAAYGVMMYVSMIFAGVFFGYTIGTAPVISFHFGAQNHKELKSLLKKSLVILSAFSVVMLLASELLARPLAQLFVGYDLELLELTVEGFRIFSIAFAFTGFAIFGSAFFTALNDGLTSAVISFLRTLVFQIAAVILLPLILGIDGIWWSITAAELLAVIVSGIFLKVKQKKYKY